MEVAGRNSSISSRGRRYRHVLSAGWIASVCPLCTCGVKRANFGVGVKVDMSLRAVIMHFV